MSREISSIEEKNGESDEGQGEGGLKLERPSGLYSP